MSVSPRDNLKNAVVQKDAFLKPGLSHQKYSKYDYHLIADPIYGGKKLKLCGQSMIADNLSRDLRQLSKYVKRAKSNEKLNDEGNNNEVAKILNENDEYVDGKNLFEYDITAGIDLKSLDLTTERETGLNIPLVYLPPDLFRFKLLQRLHLDCNQIRTIPDLLGESLINLEILTLTNNNLIFLPGSLKNLTKLKSIHLGHNKFNEFPEVLCELVSLTFLDLSCNQLEELPQNIENLTNLETFLLYQNNLKSLPESIGKLAYLTTLWIGNNKITKLPIQITALARLDWDEKNFNLSSNFDGNPLEESIIKSFKIIKNHLR